MQNKEEVIFTWMLGVLEALKGIQSEVQILVGLAAILVALALGALFYIVKIQKDVQKIQNTYLQVLEDYTIRNLYEHPGQVPQGFRPLTNRGLRRGL